MLASCMTAAAYAETLGLNATPLVFGSFMVKDPEGRISAADMSDRIFEATGYRIQFEGKSLNSSIKVLDPLHHRIVAFKIVEIIQGRIVCATI